VVVEAPIATAAVVSWVTLEAATPPERARASTMEDDGDILMD